MTAFVLLKFLADEIYPETALAAQHRTNTSSTTYEVVSLVKNGYSGRLGVLFHFDFFDMQICALQHIIAVAVYFAGHLSRPVYFVLFLLRGFRDQKFCRGSKFQILI